jgi:iron(II)-dependent oxidoreductase
MRVQRSAVVRFPDSDEGRAGVIITIFMDNVETNRPTSGSSTGELATHLREARSRTRQLTQDLSSAQLMGPMLPVVNPVLWEIGHVGWFHEFWTLRHVHGEAPILDRADRLWNSSMVAHSTRWDLDLPNRFAVSGFMSEVLERQLERLSRGIGAPASYFYELAIRHEDMHVEALTYTRQTLGYAAPEALGAPVIPNAGPRPGDTEVPGGRWRLGSTPADGFVFDNEKWAHQVDVAPFRIAKAPVTNAEYAAFVEADGYRVREFWSDEGWAWREKKGAERPAYWRAKESGRWTWRRYQDIESLPPDGPVVFVNWHEAQAWCRWAKRRLPTEAEWEAAAIGEATADGGPLAQTKRRWPWGNEPPAPSRANLDFAANAPLDVGACPAGDSYFGCRQLIGNVWEWTASDFLPFPGFSPDPYVDYSQPWFGTRKVLRGGSWATSTRLGRPGYRNFFTPERTDVIAGFRTCAL